MNDPVSETHKSNSRGRNAWRPGNIDLKGWRDIALRVKTQVIKDNVGLIFDPAEAREQIIALAGVLPGEARSLLTDQTEQLASGSKSALGFSALDIIRWPILGLIAVVALAH